VNEQPSGWAIGWTGFAAIMMILMGAWWVITGLVAILDDDFYVLTQSGYTLEFSVTAWGWIHLILGVIIFFAGFGLFQGEVWARTVGVIIAVIAALIAFAWIPYYPVWAIIFVAVSIAVIWSLTAHGRDITE